MKIHHSLTYLLGVGLLAAMPVAADTLGLKVGGGYWVPDVDGDVVAGVDVADELDIEDIGSAHVFVEFEHPVPMIPNLRLARTHIDKEGTGRLSRNFNYEGTAFATGQVTRNKVDFSHTDITMYYEIIDLGGDLDIGLTARWFEGEVDINGQVESAEIVLPMVYAKARIDLPLSDTYLAGRANIASYSGDSVSDTELTLGWQKEDFILPEFGVELGYRDFSIDVEESVFIDLDLSGAFIHFTGNF